MATVSEIVYDVRDALKQYTDDSEITNRYIEYLYGIKRAKYLRRDLNRYNLSIPNSVLQKVCLTMEEVQASDCSIDISCDTIIRSTKPVPTVLDLHTRPAITQVRPIKIGSKPFNFIPKSRVPFINGNPFSKGVYAFLDPTDYLYVFTTEDLKLLQCITVTGVFEDPLELANFPACCNCDVDENPCFDKDAEDYPIAPQHIDLIKSEIVQELANLNQSIQEDIANDAENA